MRGDLRILIRLAKADVDDGRRQVAEHRRRARQLERQVAGIDTEMARERAAARVAPPETADAYGRYASRALARRREAEGALVSAEAELAAALEALTACVQRFRALELAQAARDRERATVAARAEQSRLDDIARDRHVRNRRSPAGR